MGNEPIDEVLTRLNAVEQKGPGEYTARCPAHDDTNPSLSVSRGDHQPVVFNCHAGCDPEAIVSALGLEWSSVCENGVTEAQFEKAPWKHGEEVAAYEYHDADGAHVYTVRRYEHPERGWKSFRPYLPGKQRAGLGKQRRVLYRLPKVTEQASEGRIVFVVEGEKDVHSLEDRGFTATTSGSTSSWKDRYSDSLSGARVVVIPDNDEPGREYAQEVAEGCHEVAKWVRVVELEDVPADGGDVTDWFARGHTKDELASRVEETDNWQPGQTAVAEQQPDQASASDPWSKICGVYEDDKGQARMRAAEQVISDLQVATHRQSGHLYVWDPDKKVYTEDGEQSIRSLLVEKLGSNYSQHDVREIIGFIKPKTYRRQFGAEGFIPVANGDLRVTADGVELTEATSERGFRTRSAAEWDPDAEAPIFKNYLYQVVKTEEERATLQEYAGYSLMYWGLPFHKALFLVGPQASGKSTFLKVLQEVLGKTTQLSPQQLVDDDYGAIELEDSWANMASDIPSSLLSNVGRFKEITAGDRIFAERKYEQGYTIEPTAKHFYSANQLPEVKIDDDAFFRRVMIVAFPETIDPDQRDPKLAEKLKMELDGVLRWAIEGLQRLMTNEGFTRDLSPSQTRRLWDEHASGIGQFKIRRLNVTGHSEDVEAKQDVYRAYGEFCMENGLPTESKQKLTRVLSRDPRIGQAKRTPEGWDKQKNCYVGVQLPTEDDENGEAPF